MGKRRYSGNDKHWGPFTFSKHSNEGWRPLGFMLDSGGREDCDDGCNIKLHGFGYTLICELPQVIQPFRIKHIANSWDAATVERMGRNWYYETSPREFGFTAGDGSVHVHYGPQTHDSTTTKSKVFFLPWRQWRHVRHSFYDLDGNHFWTEGKRDHYKARWAVEAACPTVSFEFDDYDARRIQAKTRIEEREWRFGDGWFKWLSLFRRPQVRRSLNLEFSEEVGPEKGSWKGGTMGHSIDMLPGELHEAAFRRYCEQEHRSKYRMFRITYVGKVS
jgi:hypothetical protein